MPDKKRPAEPPWQVILEEIRSQNRATIEAVEASRLSLEQRIERLEQETRSRDSLLEAATRDLRATVEQNGKDIRDLKAAVQENTTDIRDVKVTVRDLAGKVEALTRLEERVAAVERRLA